MKSATFYLVSVVGAVVLTASSVQAQKAWPFATETDFVFRGIRFGYPYDILSNPDLVCEPSVGFQYEKTCTLKNYYLYEVPTVIEIKIYKEVPFELSLSTSAVYRSQIFEGLTKRYGKPCSGIFAKSVGKTVSAMWCFKYSPLMIYDSVGKLGVRVSYIDIDVKNRYPKEVDF